MKKDVRLLAILLIALFLIPMLSSFVVAQDDDSSDIDAPPISEEELGTAEKTWYDWAPTWLYNRIKIWEIGGDQIFKDPDGKYTKEREEVGKTLRFLVLILIIFIIYSVLKSVNFPEQMVAQIAIAIVGGFLATFMITTKELLTMLHSYTALGITFAIFFPIAILGFFTIIIAKKGSPTGIYIQKIAWLIFSVYLFFKTFSFFVLMKYLRTAPDGSKVLSSYRFMEYFLKPYLATTAAGEALRKGVLATYDQTILITLLVVSIAIFIIMVVSNKPVIAWLAKEARESEVEAQRSRIQRSRAYDEARSEAMQE